MLKVSGLSVAYGKHQALADVALHIARGEIVVILGANGAGKTSLLKAIAGVVPTLPGEVRTFDDASLIGRRHVYAPRVLARSLEARAA